VFHGLRRPATDIRYATFPGLTQLRHNVPSAVEIFCACASVMPAAGRSAPLQIHGSHVNLAVPYPNQRTNDMRRPVSACLAGLAALALARPAAAQMTLMAYAGIFRDNYTAVVVAPFGGQVQ
jgi:hypothetical protein